MDISYQLWSLVEQARRSATTPPASITLPSRRTRTTEETQATDSLLTTSQALDRAADMAIDRATAHISAVMAALDAVTPSSLAHLQNSLLLSDAELLSVSSSLNAFTETLTKVTALTEARRRRGRFNGAPSTATGTDDAVEDFAGDKPGGQDGNSRSGVVAHLRQAVSTLQQRIASKRLHVALAKEELALYKTELFLYGHCGVLACSDEVAAELARCVEATRKAAVSRGQHGAKAIEGAEVNALSAGGGGQQRRHHTSSKSPAPMPGFGTTFRVVDGMVQRAAETVKAAGSHADSALHVALTGGHAAARQLLHAGTASVAEILMLGALPRRGSCGNLSTPAAETLVATAGGGAPRLPTLQPYELTNEEEAHLQEQNRALLEAQRQASAQDAKAVEALVRELSQLTSLMNEQVVQQTEQFSLIFKNTEAAHTNVKKAMNEVEKPLSAFWNPTRQLVALLWLCMAVLVTVNWASR
ncbi:conserved hypothetical protein [Leishmania major strain Friedlin]|uniref:t-SNARE coiled-coil homology domain-containing protein n=1 Tax=Leishmania major TaxID=5664 RepID=Q4Q0V3_LEIMA|nr:conserved hypothetical protein [Leishmania major strain Friedlin]CAG9584009.1 hypothetical_protein_-_conserved [Leishmania major strain Friedlin]CAJ09428.1 conserved hypothetical protein [Leishmania major strain Friedlin]|eukprot:XP_001687045.1 conserved hypothetical protein [Leishmania major strain Friedlin]